MRTGAALREVVIGLLWHSVNSGNLGVGALTVSNIALARQAAAAAGVRPKFRVLGFIDPGVPFYVNDPDVEAVKLNTKAMLPGGLLWRTLATTDCVLDIGGGDSFTDIYGGRRFGFLWLSKAMTLARRIPLLLSPQTIGPFTRQPQSTLAAFAMRYARLVVARDPASFEVAAEMAPRARLLQAVDVAFALPYEPRARTEETIEVGINVSGLLFNGGYSGANEFGMEVDYAAYSRRLIEALLAKPNVAVKLISHVNTDTRPEDDDGRVADRLAAEYPAVERVRNFTSPSDAKSYISGLNFLIAGRMHACIAAFSSGVPVVPVAYSRKFSGLFEGVLNYPHGVPVKGLSTDEALAHTLALFDDRAALHADIKRGSTKIAGLLDAYRGELATLFEDVSRRRARR